MIGDWLDEIKESIGALLTECGAPGEDFTPTPEAVFPGEIFELDVRIEALEEVRRALIGEGR